MILACLTVNYISYDYGTANVCLKETEYGCLLCANFKFFGKNVSMNETSLGVLMCVKETEYEYLFANLKIFGKSVILNESSLGV